MSRPIKKLSDERQIHKNMNIILNIILAAALSVTLVSKGVANEPNTLANIQQNDLCDANNLDYESEECLTLIKRSQLTTTKLSPTIRSTESKPKPYINNVDLAPFVGGSGNVN